MKPKINAVDLSFISDDMTNGDVILNVFNCMILTDDKEKVWVEGMYFPFDKDWWISPYKGGKYECSRDSQKNDI